jgi:hypothetical protein
MSMASKFRVTYPILQVSWNLLYGAGGGNRTLVTSLENWDNSRYTTPAEYT